MLLVVQDLHRKAAVRYRQELLAQGGGLTRGELQLVDMVNSGPSCMLAAAEVRGAVDPVTGPGGSVVS